MRAFIQKVTQATVSVDNKVIGSIQKGLVVLLGIAHADTQEDINYLCRKIVNMRLFDDEAGVMNHSVMAAGGDIMVVSQFTLLANTRKGNRPSYIEAAPPQQAEPLYQSFVQEMQQQLGRPVAQGQFGGYMQLQLTNDGPVSIWIESPQQQR